MDRVVSQSIPKNSRSWDGYDDPVLSRSNESTERVQSAALVGRAYDQDTAYQKQDMAFKGFVGTKSPSNASTPPFHAWVSKYR